MEQKRKHEKPNISIDDLKWIYMECLDAMIPESEAIQDDLTETFWKTIKGKIDARELINIAIRGEVRSGKSTVAIKLMYEINKYLHSIGLNDNVLRIMNNLIFSDQTEFLRFIDSNERNVAFVIDEFNSMAKTGLNATTEEALFDTFSDVFAGQYQHRMTVSPSNITDKNATIILDVIGKDEKQKIVRCKLNYRDVVSGRPMVIGRVDIYIGDIIKLWESGEVKRIVETTGVQNLEDQRIIDEAREKDFYVRYQIKKYKRMDLIKKEGVRDIRELEWADIILEILRELEDDAKIEKVDFELIAVQAKMVLRRMKRFSSILLERDIASRAMALLNLYTKIHKMYKKIENPAKNAVKLTAEEAMVMKKIIAKRQEKLDSLIKEQEYLSDLYRQYLAIK